MLEWFSLECRKVIGPSCLSPLWQNDSSFETIHPRIFIQCVPPTCLFSFKLDSFSYKKFYTKTRFETEAQGNSEMACWFCITTPCDWLKKLVPLFHPTTEFDCNLLTHVFPRFTSASATCIWVLIGSLDCLSPLWLAKMIFRVFFVRHSIQNCSAILAVFGFSAVTSTSGMANRTSAAR